MSALYRLEMKPHSKYVKTVSRPFHLSSATLECGQYAKLYLTVNSVKLEVASLTPTNRHRNIDLNFMKGDKLIFHVVGKGNITLLGYTLPRGYFESEDENESELDDDDFKDNDDESDASDENSDEDGDPMDAPPKKKCCLTLDSNPNLNPNLESNGDAEMDVDPQDADGAVGGDVKMSTEDD